MVAQLSGHRSTCLLGSAAGTSRRTAVPACRPCVPSTSLRRVRTEHVTAAILSATQQRQRLQPVCAAAAVLDSIPAADETVGAHEVLSSTWYDAGGVKVDAAKTATGDYEVVVEAAEPRSLVLHWAVDEWVAPSLEHAPPGTVKVDDKAVQTPFVDGRHLTITFPAAAAPERLVFVLKETGGPQGDIWINNGSCFGVQLKAPSLDAVSAKVLTAEGEYSNWSLLNRFVLANEVLDAAEAAGPEGMAFVFTWLRLSSNKLLDWARNANYQSKDIAWMQKVISDRMATKARSASDPWVRLYARLALAGLPRGGGNGDDIRHGILNVMRENGIREGHRPGLDEPFLEQWHQKLHQNTTPEDVTICEAYLAFLHSGNHDDYWRVLWDNGRITQERLENMHIPLKAWPKHLPHLIGPMQHYLWVLKTCHSGADMDTAAEMAKGYLDDDLRWNLFDMLNQRDAWWVPGKIADIRGRLAHVWRAPGASRDVLLLDIALDAYFRTCVERADRGSMSRDDLVELVTLVLRNATVAAESEELNQCFAQWDRLKNSERWGRDWALGAMAAAQRTQLSLGAYADTMYGQVQPAAEAFGAKCNIDSKYIVNFGEEVVRGQSVFVLSLLLAQLEPQIRQAAGAGNWQVVSQAAAAGEVMLCPSLGDIQGQAFDRPVIVLAQRLGGMEDIPEGVVAVLTESSTDVLSHVAIRARTQGVLLATCFGDSEWQALNELQGKHANLEVTAAGDITATAVEAPTATSSNGSTNGNGAKLPPLKIPAPSIGSALALGEAGFRPGLVGAKANNLATLRRTLPDWIQVPRSVALPFGTFEKVMADPANTAATKSLASLLKELSSAPVGGGVPAQLAALRKLVATELKAPKSLVQELTQEAAAAGLVQAGQWAAGAKGAQGWAPAWAAICQVWASKWADRAWLSRRARGVAEKELYMSVLLQQVVPAQYAFVLHTANPITGAHGELFGEMVPGMGEALVGNFPGRALSFSSTQGSPEPVLLSLPSKRTALRAPPGGTLIARSDTNGEDLEAFAGAGLYDSVPVVPLVECPIDYSQEPLMWDAGFRAPLLSSVTKAGAAVEEAFGGVPQDVEGVWVDGVLTVVQARPQVL